MQQFIEVEPVLAGPISEDVINLHGFYSESQAVKYTRDINVFNNNRKRDQARAQAYEAQRQGRELDKLRNPAYAGLKFVHDAGPSGSATQAYLNFDAGNTGTGIIYSALAILHLNFLRSINGIAVSTKGIPIGSVGSNSFGIDNATLRSINHTSQGLQRGGINCVGCAIAVDATIKGRLASAVTDLLSRPKLADFDL